VNFAAAVQIKKLPGATKEAVLKDIDACYEERPWLAMVDSGKGEILVLLGWCTRGGRVDRCVL
jgi:monomeric isocitrate dehydrogenase